MSWSSGLITTKDLDLVEAVLHNKRPLHWGHGTKWCAAMDLRFSSQFSHFGISNSPSPSNLNLYCELSDSVFVPQENPDISFYKVRRQVKRNGAHTSFSEVPQTLHDLHSMHCHWYVLTACIMLSVNCRHVGWPAEVWWRSKGGTEGWKEEWRILDANAVLIQMWAGVEGVTHFCWSMFRWRCHEIVAINVN